MFAAALLLALIAAEEPAESPPPPAKLDPIRKFYATTAARYEFYRNREKNERLTLVTTPVFKWSTDDDWSGDVFVWTDAQRPAVIGCILSGPGQNGGREAYQEFHLLSERPIENSDMLKRFRWAPAEGLPTALLKGAPTPATTPALRLSQMRKILQDFSASMSASGEWELRPLPQPLMRYQPTSSNVVDGALFAYIWPKGTDPELILLLECRKSASGLEWCYAPARFSVREMWLKYEGKEVWRCPDLAGANNSNPKKLYLSDSIGPVPAQDVTTGTHPE